MRVREAARVERIVCRADYGIAVERLDAELKFDDIALSHNP
ncbi:MAG: hypothetical protein ABFE02_08750 [Sulfuricella sp.]